MPAQIARLRTKADRLRSDTAAQLRQLVLEYPGLPERARGEIIGTIDRQTASEAGWTFVMLSPEQNAAVMRWLRQHSQRPVLALALWGELFTALRRDTGEVMLTRDELAERIGATPVRCPASCTSWRASARSSSTASGSPGCAAAAVQSTS